LLGMSEKEMHDTLIAVANNRFDGAKVLVEVD
jgi:hypothetical protein